MRETYGHTDSQKLIKHWHFHALNQQFLQFCTWQASTRHKQTVPHASLTGLFLPTSRHLSAQLSVSPIDGALVKSCSLTRP